MNTSMQVSGSQRVTNQATGEAYLIVETTDADGPLWVAVHEGGNMAVAEGPTAEACATDLKNHFIPRAA